MYPIHRLAASSIRAALSEPMDFNAVSKTTFRCMPWDLDIFMEMNNGRILTLFDLGRFDLTIRSRFFKVLLKKRWGLVIAGSSVRYRKRIKLFDKVTMLTQVAGFEGRWIYLVQSMWVKGEPCASVLLRSGLTCGGKAVPTDEVLKAVNVSSRQGELPGWIKSWIAGDNERPWPPAPAL